MQIPEIPQVANRPQRVRKRPDFYGNPVLYTAVDEVQESNLKHECTLKDESSLIAQSQMIALIDIVKEIITICNETKNAALTADFQACTNVDYIRNMHFRLLEIEKSLATN